MAGTCPYCKVQLVTLGYNSTQEEGGRCWVSAGRDLRFKESHTETDSTTYCCQDCGKSLPLHDQDDAVAFLLGEKELTLSEKPPEQPS